MDVNAQLWQLKTLQRYFMGGVALFDQDYPMRLVVRPDKMQICARLANLSGASVRSAGTHWRRLRPVSTNTRVASSFPAYLVNQSRPRRERERERERELRPRLQEGSRALVRLAGDRRTDAPCLIHIQRKLNMREAVATAHGRRLGRKTGLSGD